MPCSLLIAAALALAPSAPPLAITVPCNIVDCYDGDTLTVDITIRARVRLLDNWSPELRDPGGPEAKAALQSLTSGRRAVLSIPLDGVDRLDDVFSFGRLLGHVRMADQAKTLSAQMVEGGHASTTKGGDLGR